MVGKQGGLAPALSNGSIWCGINWVVSRHLVDWLVDLPAGAGGDGREEDGAKIGLPAMDLSLAFPQATPASVFPPSGEKRKPCFSVSFGQKIELFGLWIGC